MPGVWFFSLDASNTLAVLGARVALGLPYFRARMRLQEEHAGIQFTSTRTHPGGPAARFEGTWARGEPLPLPPPDSLDFFLVERYCLYTIHWGRLYRVRIFHRPWPLRRVERLSFTSTMLESQGLPTPPEARAARAGRAPPGGHLASRAALTDHLSPPAMPASWSAALLAILEELQRHAARHRSRDVLAKLQEASVEQAIAYEFD